MPTGGEDVPPELFWRILDLLTLPHNIHHGKRNKDYVAVTKHELACCALVNRYWAEICQPKIFEMITLKAGADVHQFIELLDRPGSKLREYVLMLGISPQVGPCVPWIHLLPTLEPRLPRVNTYFVVRLVNPHPQAATSTNTSMSTSTSTSTTVASIRSMHIGLPRAPPQFSRNIRRLELWDVRFRRFADLVHVLGELPDLASVQCRQLSWEGATELRTCVRGVPSGNNGNLDVFVKECTDNAAAAAWIHLGTRRRAEVCIACEEVGHVAALARSLEAGIDAEKWARQEVVVNALRPRNRLAVSVALNFMAHKKSGDTIDDRQTACMPQLYALAVPEQGQNQRTGHVVTIAVDFTHGKSILQGTFDADWETFAVSASSLPTLDTVMFGFETLDDMAVFVEEVAKARMPGLHNSNKLRYLVMKLPWGMWMYASPGSEELKNSGFEQLGDIAMVRYLT